MIRRGLNIVMYKTITMDSGLRLINKAPFHGRMIETDGQVDFEFRPGVNHDEIEFVRDERENSIMIVVKGKDYSNE